MNNYYSSNIKENRHLEKLNTVLPPLSDIVGSYMSPLSSLSSLQQSLKISVDNKYLQRSQSNPANMKQTDYYQNSFKPYFDCTDGSYQSYERTRLSHSAPGSSQDFPYSCGYRPQPRYTSYERTSLSNTLHSSRSDEYTLPHLRLSSDTPREFSNSHFCSSDNPKQNSQGSGGPSSGNIYSGTLDIPEAIRGLARLSHAPFTDVIGRHSTGYSGASGIGLLPPLSTCFDVDGTADDTTCASNSALSTITSTVSSTTPTPPATIGASSSTTTPVTANSKHKTKLKRTKASKSFTKISNKVSVNSPTAVHDVAKASTTIRLSQKRYSIPGPGDKKNSQGRPFTDSMSINLTITRTVDDVFTLCLGIDNYTSRTANVEFIQVDKANTSVKGDEGQTTNRRQSISSPTSESDDHDLQKIKIDNNNIAAGIRKLFSVRDFYFVQVVRSSTNQDRCVDRDLRSLPAQKLIAIPCPENDDDITCKFLKQIIAHPRYKCNMKFFIVEGKLDQTEWHYTSFELMEQEKRQLALGEITCPTRVALIPPSSVMLVAIGRRRTRRGSSTLKRKGSFDKDRNGSILVENFDILGEYTYQYSKCQAPRDHEVHDTDTEYVPSVKSKAKTSRKRKRSGMTDSKLNLRRKNFDSQDSAVIDDLPSSPASSLPSLASPSFSSSSSSTSDFIPSIPPLENPRASIYSNRKVNVELYNKMSMKVLIN